MEYFTYDYEGENMFVNKKEFYTFDEAIDNVILNQVTSRLYLEINEVKSKARILIPFELNRIEEKIKREEIVFLVLGLIKKECYNDSELDNLWKNLCMELGVKYGKI